MILTQALKISTSTSNIRWTPLFIRRMVQSKILDLRQRSFDLLLCHGYLKCQTRCHWKFHVYVCDWSSMTRQYSIYTFVNSNSKISKGYSRTGETVYEFLLLILKQLIYIFCIWMIIFTQLSSKPCFPILELVLSSSLRPSRG